MAYPGFGDGGYTFACIHDTINIGDWVMTIDDKRMKDCLAGG